jgi:outer membrane protein assembly factor BamB
VEVTFSPRLSSSGGHAYIFRDDAAVNRWRFDDQGFGFPTFAWGHWVSLARSGCDDKLLHAPLVHRWEWSTDLHRATYSFDLVYAGTAYKSTGSGNCSTHKTNNKVRALNAEDGSVWWTFNGDVTRDVDDVYGMTLDYPRNILYIACERTASTSQNSVFAINTTTGTHEWSVSPGRIWADPILRGDRLYIATLAGELKALDPADGSEIWTLGLGTGVPFPSDMVAPLIPPYHDAILVQDYLGTIHLARDEGSTGVWDWSTPAPAGGPGVLALDPIGGSVFFGDGNGVIHQLDAATGVPVTTMVLDTIPSWPTALVLDWSLAGGYFTVGERTELLAASSEATIGRFCIQDQAPVRDFIGPDGQRTATTDVGQVSHEDTDTGDAAVVVHTLSYLMGPTTLTRFEAVAGGVGPCDLGRGPTPCLEQMEFFLMGWPAGVSIQGDVADPSAPGKAFHVDVTSRVTIVRQFGTNRYGGGDLVETALLSFDLSGLGLECPTPGFRIGLMGRGSASAHGELEIQFVRSGVNVYSGDAWHRYPAVPDSVPMGSVGVRIQGDQQVGTSVGERVRRPAVFALEQCYPNPFNPVTTIRYDLPEPQRVTLHIYDVSGRLVRVLRNAVYEDAGSHEAAWYGRDDQGHAVSSGVYFYRLTAGGYTETKRMTLVR